MRNVDCEQTYLNDRTTEHLAQLPASRNSAQAETPACSCIHELFEARARCTPDLAAVSFEGRELSYRELDHSASRLAHRLRQLGVGPEMLVGLCAERSLNAAVAILGILKAGAAYVPLDPAYPKARLAYMLADAGVSVLLAQREVLAQLPPYDGDILYLDDELPDSPTEGLAQPLNDAGPDNLAYVIYTSGSTGQPKGVAVTHRPLCNLIWWQIHQFPLGRPARTLQLASLSFDVSIQELFSTWCAGGLLIPVPERTRRDPAALLDFMERESVERIFLPFSALHQLAVAASLRGRHGGKLREIVTAGEQLRITPEIVTWLKSMPDCVLYNQYGPTETHVVVTSHALSGDPMRWPTLPPLGRAIPNVSIHILDEDRHPVPIGEPGEIYVGGASLARGYLNRPELTAERFVPNPFCDEADARLYRTGDLARYQPDGNIEFLGRLDQQVKVRGFRIELGEIETVLDQHPNICEAAVVARDNGSDGKRLVAYVVPRRNPAPHTSALREFLNGRLPEYMLPSAFVELESLPLTPNGKVDWKALPPPPDERPPLAQPYRAPNDPVEQRLASILADVLGIRPIGVDDDFFELGGDSLRATRVLARVESTFGVRYPHQWLFEGPSVAQMAQRLKAMQARGMPAPMPVVRSVKQEHTAPLSYGQEEIWAASQLHPGLPIYNEPFAIHIPDAVDTRSLERALNALVERHEILRTGFAVEDGQPVQRVYPSAPVHMEYLDLRPLPAARRVHVAVAQAEGEARRPFDLSRPPLLRAVLAFLDDREYRLFLVVHHIIVDAVSVYDVLLPELWALYRASKQGLPTPLGPLPLQYADYARWQRSWLQGPVMEDNLRYWEERLANAPVLDLPTDRPSPPSPSRRGAFEPFAFPQELHARLNELAREQGVTLYVVLLSAFLTLLWRYSRQDDLVVGTAEVGRSRSELEPLVGYFVNTLALRANLSGDPGFSVLLERVRSWMLEAHAHKDCPLLHLGSRMQSRGQAGLELFRVAFIMEPSMPVQASGWTISQLEVQTGTSKFDLTLELEARKTIIGRLEYATDLFDASTIRRLISHYRALLEAVVTSPQRRLSELTLLPAKERHQLLVEWNQTRHDYPRGECIHSLFAAQANFDPEAVALVCGERRLSYGELNSKANQLAHYLRRLGVAPDVPVGVYGERSLEIVIAILAVLKAGGAYVPLDPDYPQDRLRFMLEDSDPPVLLAQRDLPLPSFAGQVVVLEDGLTCIEGESTDDPAVEPSAEHLAYVMYTSGSTGIPKGVAVPHRAVVRLVRGIDYADPGNRQISLLLAPLGFDASTFELWGPLLHGGCCVVISERVPTLQRLGRAIADHGVNTLWLTAAFFNAVIDEAPEILRPVRQLFTGGEALSPSHIHRALALLPETRLVNGYGPTEATTFTCCYSIPRDFSDLESSVPIGRPISNTRVYVLDEYLNPVPAGIPGELYIGGDGLARGYLNRPELTAERFIASPFDAHERLYRTGDRARYRQDGNLEFLGRLDAQVKVRGFRIEPGEIEAALAAHPMVREAVVIARGDHEKRLIAYVVPRRRLMPDTVQLLDFLKKRLPTYMLPSTFVSLEALPLTANGKVDRSALPPDTPEQPRKAHMGPRNVIEVQLVRMWEHLLGRFPVGVKDDFFELGGNSLIALQVVDRIRQLFEREVQLDAIWHHGRTIAGLASLLQDQEGESIWSRAVPIRRHGSRRPLFCAHVAGGHIYYFDNLSRYLDSGQPVYGLPARGTDGQQPPHDTIEAIAAHGIKLMREVQPHGPYALLGYCSGGVTAFEMARQLKDQGEDIALLALIDSEHQTLGGHLKSISREALREKNFRLPQERLYALTLNAVGLPQLRRPKGVGETHRWALWRYKAQPYSGRVVLFRPADYEYSRDPALGWGRLVQGGVEVRVLPGRHGDLVKEPGIQLLAAELKKYLS